MVALPQVQRPALRPYQSLAVAAVERDLAIGRSALVEAATGTGKTTTFSEVARRELERGGRVLVLAHRRELVDQAVARLRSLGLGVALLRGRMRWSSARVIVASIQSMGRRLDQWRSDAFTLLIADECFPAGTMVDGRPIEQLQPGDLVRSYNHQTNKVELRLVVRLFKSRPKALVRVHFSDGRSITCTAGHPFWTGKAYTPALGLLEGDAVYTDSRSVHGMQEADVHQDQAPARFLCGTRSDLLLEAVQRRLLCAAQLGAYGADESEVREPAHDGQKSDAAGLGAREDVQHPAQDEARAEGSRRKRHRSERVRADVAGGARGGLDLELHFHNEHDQGIGVSVSLQVGSCPSRDLPRDQGGRVQPLCASASGTGSQEGGLVDVARVVRVEVLELSGDGELERVCPGGHVYNFEVEGNHNYFVDGILVHNCHHAPAPGWVRVREYFASARLLGVTATPDRADGVSLRSMFERVSARYGIAEAVNDGYLVPARGLRIQVPGMDLSQVRRRKMTAAGQSPVGAAGELHAKREVFDLHPKDLGRAAIAPAAVEGVAGPLLELAGDRRTVVFCVDVAHAQAVTESLNARRPGCARAVWGSSSTRAQDLAAHQAGTYQFLANVMVLTEGYDDPAIACVAMARPTQSRVLYAQACGRGLRPAPAKADCLVLDFAGASCQHDLVGPEDALAGALISMVSVPPTKAAGPALACAELAYRPNPTWRARFTTAAVKLVRRGARVAATGAVVGAKAAGGFVAWAYDLIAKRPL